MDPGTICSVTSSLPTPSIFGIRTKVRSTRNEASLTRRESFDDIKEFMGERALRYSGCEATTDGTKNTDVNLYVYDATGKEVGKDESPGPKCSVKVTPEKDGNYKFVIKNAGGNNSVTFEVKVAN
jgi:hypothetical protein